MSVLSRRALLHVGAGGVAGFSVLGSLLASAAPKAQRSMVLTNTGVPLAPPAPLAGPAVVPIPAPSPLGIGKARAIAFGGGGEWFVFWMLGYCMTAKGHGVDVENVDLTIGTSAGSIMGSYVSAGTVSQAHSRLSQLAANPEVLAKMIVTDTGADSQQRATQVLASATSTGVESLQEIGRAAMAAALHYPGMVDILMKMDMSPCSE